MGHRTQYFMFLWRYSCLYYECAMLEAVQSHSNCSNSTKMPKNTTACQKDKYTEIYKN